MVVLAQIVDTAGQVGKKKKALAVYFT